MKKFKRTFLAQLLTFETSLPFNQVIAQLDKEVNKEECLQFLSKFRLTETKDGLENLFRVCLSDRDFVYFLEMNHGKWMNIYGNDISASSVVYTIGNPQLAATIMQHEIVAGYLIPPRIMVFQKDDKTMVMYHLPSSLINCEGNPDLKVALEVLDDKLESMVTRITAPVE